MHNNPETNVAVPDWETPCENCGNVPTVIIEVHAKFQDH